MGVGGLSTALGAIIVLGASIARTREHVRIHALRDGAKEVVNTNTEEMCLLDASQVRVPVVSS